MLKFIVDYFGKEVQKMRPTEKDVNKIYFFTMVLLITLGSFVQRKSLYIGLVITEFGIILLPVMLYLLIKRYDIKYVLRLNPIKVEHGFLVFLIIFFSWFVSTFLALLTNYFLSKLGKIPVSPVPAAQNIGELVLQILIISCTAAFCEEMLMRGLIMRGYEMRGSIKSVFITAVFFAALHLNVQNFLSIIFLGSILGFVVYRTDSIYAGMIGHFTNNTMSILMTYFFGQVGRMGGMAAAGQKIEVPLLSVIFYGIIAAAFGAFLYLLLKYLIKTTEPYIIYSPTGIREDLKIFLHWPILLSLMIFLSMMIYELLKIAGII